MKNLTINTNILVKNHPNLHYIRAIRKLNKMTGCKFDAYRNEEGELMLAMRSGHEMVMLDMMKMKISGELESIILGTE